jgi:hypothetical protein
MSIVEIPLSFKFDSERDIVAALQYDVLSNLMDMQASFFQRSYSQPVREIANRIFENTDSIENSFRNAAFCGAAAMTHEAFIESDIPLPFLKPTLSQFALGEIPLRILGDTAEESLERLEMLAREGHASHPELKDQTSYVVEYYTEISQQAELGRIAYSGAGFTIYQIEASWQHARNQQIDKICQKFKAETNWDSLFE